MNPRNRKPDPFALSSETCLLGGLDAARSPRVSVVLPFHNERETLDVAIESIRGQTFEDWELILVDDGSDDGSTEAACAHAARDERIQYIGLSHGGIVNALVAGCNTVRGEFIARMDADDVSAPDRLAGQLRFMETHPEIVLCGAHVRMVGPRIGIGRRRYERWINSLKTCDAIMRDLFVECPIAHPTFMMRTAGYRVVGGYEDRGWPEDYDLIMRLMLAGERFGKAPGVLLDWHERPERLSMTSRRYAPLAFRKLKRHYLMQTHLAEGKVFFQWGAGKTGKPWLRAWTNPKPEAVVDINERKIGTEIHGVKVIRPEDLPPPGALKILVAVGAPGARAEIRSWLNPRGYVELTDYLFIA